MYGMLVRRTEAASLSGAWTGRMSAERYILNRYAQTAEAPGGLNGTAALPMCANDAAPDLENNAESDEDD